MKRSEILAIIEEYLEKFDMGGRLSHLTYADSSNVLLCRLEIAGMRLMNLGEYGSQKMSKEDTAKYLGDVFDLDWLPEVRVQTKADLDKVLIPKGKAAHGRTEENPEVIYIAYDESPWITFSQPTPQQVIPTQLYGVWKQIGFDKGDLIAAYSTEEKALSVAKELANALDANSKPEYDSYGLVSGIEYFVVKIRVDPEHLEYT